MNLLLLGATGRTGRELLLRALDQDHQVTALARDPSKLTVQHERLRIVSGSATDPAVLEKAVADQDAVLCALGPRSANALMHCDLMRRSISPLINALQRSRAKRLVVLSALGVGQSAQHAPAISRSMFRTILRQVGKDKEAAEQSIRASQLDWTIVYPPSLTNGPATGSYQHGAALELRGLPKISRADVAEFMLAQLTDTSYNRKPAIIGP